MNKKHYESEGCRVSCSLGGGLAGLTFLYYRRVKWVICVVTHTQTIHWSKTKNINVQNNLHTSGFVKSRTISLRDAILIHKDLRKLLKKTESCFLVFSLVCDTFSNSFWSKNKTCVFFLQPAWVDLHIMACSLFFYIASSFQVTVWVYERSFKNCPHGIMQSYCIQADNVVWQLGSKRQKTLAFSVFDFYPAQYKDKLRWPT